MHVYNLDGILKITFLSPPILASQSQNIFWFYSSLSNF